MHPTIAAYLRGETPQDGWKTWKEYTMLPGYQEYRAPRNTSPSLGSFEIASLTDQGAKRYNVWNALLVDGAGIPRWVLVSSHPSFQDAAIFVQERKRSRRPWTVRQLALGEQGLDGVAVVTD